MRNEQQMIDLIVGFAENDERIRAVCMNGSRTNPNAPADCFSDYDIVYIVSDRDEFVNNSEWINVFGERIIMQEPENMELFKPELYPSYTYLMQFTDGNRIDLMIKPISEVQKYIAEDRLLRVLLDKDNLFAALPEPSDCSYYVRKPTQRCFGDCANEFWWTACYVAKGLWRGELLYSAYHMESCVRSELLRMMSWYAGALNDFEVSVGKCCKYLNKYIYKDDYSKLLSTLDCSDEQSCYKALFTAMNLFDKYAEMTADMLGYMYDIKTASETRRFIEHIWHLPKDAKEIY